MQRSPPFKQCRFFDINTSIRFELMRLTGIRIGLRMVRKPNHSLVGMLYNPHHRHRLAIAYAVAQASSIRAGYLRILRSSARPITRAPPGKALGFGPE